MRKHKSTSSKSGPCLGRRAFVGTVAATSFGLTGVASEAGAGQDAGAEQKLNPPPASPVQAGSAAAGGGRSMVLRAKVDSRSGIPLGGLGTGSMEIRPDGYFHEWMIFNLGEWSAAPDQQDPAMSANMTPNAFAFFLRVLPKNGKPVVRRLGLRSDQFSARMETVWARNVEAIEYEGNFPVATLRYLDSTLPVRITGRFFSPMIPHDSRTSGTPGFHASFHFRNTSDRPVELSLASVLRNPLALGAADRKLRTTVEHQGESAYLTMRTDAQGGQAETLGSLCLSVTGGEPGWIGADFGPYLGNGYSADNGLGAQGDPLFSMRFSSFLRDFRRTGRLPNLEADENPAPKFPKDADGVAKLSFDEIKSLLARAGRVSSLKHNVEAAVQADPAFLTDERLMRLLVTDLCRHLNVMAGAQRNDRTWGDGALSSTVRLAPGEEKEISFALGWHFPHHISRSIDLGHMYEQWFKDAEEVNRFLVSGRTKHLAATTAFAQTMLETNLDPELAFSWTAQLTTLVKGTWWSRNGRFGVWEGLGCCGLNTTDIVYQGSFPAIALYPDLQMKEMEVEHAGGRVNGSFFPDLGTPRRTTPGTVNGYAGRSDISPQLVMLICRDYLWSGDAGFLKRMWPCVLSSMKSRAVLDADGDGLPDHDAHRQTYDQWNMSGSPSYIGSLWLGALEAGIRMAEDLGESSQAEEWRATLQKAVSAFESRLWNGEYYSLWVNGAQRDENCMTDQLSGLWFSNLMGVGHALPRERILAALASIVRYNFDPEQGCQNGIYPPGRTPRMPTHENMQANACWTGVEYAISSMLIDFGMVRQGVDVARAVHDRYLRAGACWNHNECGSHYHRAMSSWATLLAATGFKPDAPRHTLTIAPVVKLPDLRAPWVHSTGWGQLVAGANRFELRCHSGSVSFAVLRLKGAGLKSATLNGRILTCKAADQNGLSVLTFASPVEVRAGQRLIVTAGTRG